MGYMIDDTPIVERFMRDYRIRTMDVSLNEGEKYHFEINYFNEFHFRKVNK